MNREDVKDIIKNYLESNEGNLDMHGLTPDGAADIEAMAEKLTEKICEYVRYKHYMEALDRRYAAMR